MKFPFNFLKLNVCRIPLSLFFFFFSLLLLMLLLPFFFFADDDDGDLNHDSILPPANHSVHLFLTKLTPAFPNSLRIEPRKLPHARSRSSKLPAATVFPSLCTRRDLNPAPRHAFDTNHSASAPPEITQFCARGGSKFEP